MKLKDLDKKFIVRPRAKVSLKKHDPGYSAGFKNKEQTLKFLAKNQLRLRELQYLLYAHNKYALLIILQGMDGSGKDGTIRHVMYGVNPQACKVTSFKKPSTEELDHDFLWRIHKAVPPKGEIGIFNRSHYEDVLIVRVHNLVPKNVWSERYEQINDFEKILSTSNVKILKFFLHISKSEQKERFQKRLDNPNKHWKMNPEDLKERRLWNEYTKAYEAALSRCSTELAPWFIIPANKKWFRNLAISQIIVETLEKMDMEFPQPTFDPKKIIIP
jgi:PPK2 family polyphosphate:nucleotide phosphotransferase